VVKPLLGKFTHYWFDQFWVKGGVTFCKSFPSYGQNINLGGCENGGEDKASGRFGGSNSGELYSLL
jgi:hypothetical protein